MKIKTITNITRFIVQTFLAASCGQNSAMLQFKTVEVQDFIKHPQATEDNHGLRYKFDFVYPSSFGNKAVLEKLQKQFIRYTIGEDYIHLTPAKAVDACIVEYKKAYDTEIEEMRKSQNDPDWLNGWFIYCSNSILFQNEALLQLKTTRGISPDFSEPTEWFSYPLFNLKTGDVYSRDDIFKPEAADYIHRLLVDALLNYWEGTSPHDIRLMKEEVWTEKTQFAVTHEGIAFVYSDDEMGSYTLGNEAVTIPYVQIFSCLKEKTPVWDFADIIRGTVEQNHIVDDFNKNSAINKGRKVETDVPMEVYLEAFQNVFNNEAPHFDTEKKQNISFADYCNEHSISEANMRLAVADMDGDGVPEVLLEHAPGIIRVLRFETGVVYGFSFGFRAMRNLKK
ncbi:MAG: RsiV family protein, partial [Tannerella sp.]|nr:RsiV family protein [Tannerella sp.]